MPYIIKKRTKNKNTKNYKKNKQKSTKQYKPSRIQHGRGFFNIFTSGITTTRDLRTPPLLPAFRLKTNPHSAFPRFFQVIYNRSSPLEFNLDTKLNFIIPKKLVELEPNITIADYNQYLVALIQNKPFPSLLWLAVFKGHTKSKTILTYMHPKPPHGIVGNYSLQLYLYPTDNIPPYTSLNLPINTTIPPSPTDVRNKELNNFLNYINQYRNVVKLLPQHTKIFNVQRDTLPGNKSFINQTIHLGKLARNIRK